MVKIIFLTIKMKIVDILKYPPFITALILLIILYIVFNPARHAKHYLYVRINDILPQLVQISNIKNTRLKLCSYDEIILYNHDINFKETFNYQYQVPLKGGEYIPTHCTPLFKVAVIIPYRNREEQLKIFVNYVHYFLQKQNIHYRIYIVDQRDNAPFNRAKMFNIGAHEAIKAEFPCLILHDVDLIPLTTGNIYACTLQPRHMSSSIDIFRFNLPYEGLFGGVISIQTNQFRQVNGMSNMYEGWGGEDDDLFSRLNAQNIHPCRFPAEFSKYTMLKHKKAKPSENRYNLLHTSLDRQNTDGLSELLRLTNFTVHDKLLFTHIIVT